MPLIQYNELKEQNCVKLRYLRNFFNKKHVVCFCCYLILQHEKDLQDEEINNLDHKHSDGSVVHSAALPAIILHQLDGEDEEGAV